MHLNDYGKLLLLLHSLSLSLSLSLSYTLLALVIEKWRQNGFSQSVGTCLRCKIDVRDRLSLSESDGIVSLRQLRRRLRLWLLLGRLQRVVGQSISLSLGGQLSKGGLS